MPPAEGGDQSASDSGTDGPALSDVVVGADSTNDGNMTGNSDASTESGISAADGSDGPTVGSNDATPVDTGVSPTPPTLGVPMLTWELGPSIPAPTRPAVAWSSGDASVPPIAFVQQASSVLATGTSATANVGLSPQQAGNLIVIAVGWTDTSESVDTVSDTLGNTYKLAIGPTREGQDLSQSIYYANSVAAGTNQINVTFSTPVNGIDLRVAEYSGLSAVAPLDVTAGASGTTATANSGNATTTVGRELLFGAGMCTNAFLTPSSGFTVRVITGDGDIAEDETVAVTGTYAAGGAIQTTAPGWVMQLATFQSEAAGSLETECGRRAKAVSKPPRAAGALGVRVRRHGISSRISRSGRGRVRAAKAHVRRPCERTVGSRGHDS